MTTSDEGRPSDPIPALVHADRLLREADPGTAGLWPRTAARLTRLALERAADQSWYRTRPEVLTCPTTMRILMLEGRLGRVAARDAYLVWCRLSDATHPHPYELAPTAGELRRWHNEVSGFVSLLDPAVDRPPGSAVQVQASAGP
jgi:hypothetical protein